MSDEDKTIIAPLAQIRESENLKKKAIPSLVQYNGAQLGKRYLLDRVSVTLGRSLNADICISEASVSRLHAVISQKIDKIYIEDTESANGTFINDKKISSSVLKDQDMVRLGTVLLKFFASDNVDSMIQDKIYRMATIDAGTQIFNKQYLLDTLGSEFKLSKSSSRPLSIIYYDLDHFKMVNDRYGHNIGDQVLRENAQLVKTVIRKEDVLGRFGGEEFIVILPNTDINTAFELAERIRKICDKERFELEFEVDGQKQMSSHQQTISIGVSEISHAMSTPIDLLESADKKLYFSKQNGRNRVTR